MKKNKKSQTIKKKSTPISRIVVILISSAAIIALCAIGYNQYMYGSISTINEKVNYEEQLFQNAQEDYENPEVILDSSIELKSVFLDSSDPESDPFYHFQLSGFDTPQGFKIGEFYGDDEKYLTISEETTFADFSKRQELIIESARDHVVKYIQDSKVLTEKDKLIEGIENIPFYLYTESSHDILKDLDAPAIHCGNAIYCNQEYEKYFCEWIFVHELFHHLRYLTCGNFSSERYYSLYLDEAIADLLTCATQPKTFSSDRYANGYEIYHEPVNKYLAVFGEDALYSYFYGYNEFFSSYTTFKTEHDAFAFALQYYGEDVGPTACCEALIKYWHSQFE